MTDTSPAPALYVVNPNGYLFAIRPEVLPTLDLNYLAASDCGSTETLSEAIAEAVLVTGCADAAELVGGCEPEELNGLCAQLPNTLKLDDEGAVIDVDARGCVHRIQPTDDEDRYPVENYIADYTL